MARSWRSILLIGCCLLLGGCAGFGGEEQDGRAVERVSLPTLVLQPSDLPNPLARFDEGPQRLADASPGPRADPGRFGRLGGWLARYRRAGTDPAPGPGVVESRVDAFKDAEGAERDFEGLRSELESAVRGGAGATRWLDPPAVGDDVLAITTGLDGRSDTVRFFVLAWRQGNVTAALSVSGFEGSLDLADVVEFARKQERRIDAASR